MTSEFDEKLAKQWYQRKTAFMEKMLGKEHDMVMHAIIPFCVGGGLDLYYFPNGMPGTAIATKELSEIPNEGSANSVYDTYELVMFTKQVLSMDDALDKSTWFGKAHSNANAILNHIAPYSTQAVLNPGDTCEFPADMDGVGGKCLVFDGYADYSDDVVTNFGLMAIIEVFRSEMEFAREHGSDLLFARLKARGVYPYFDLDREPVA